MREVGIEIARVSPILAAPPGRRRFLRLDHISMSVRQILKTSKIVCIVPDTRKAKAVKECFDGEISPGAPASILRTHADTTVYLDVHSAALLNPATLLSAP